MTSNVQNTVGPPEPTIPLAGPNVDSQLGDGEQVQAWLETDLDHDPEVCQRPGAVTNRRLLAQAAGQAGWQEWPLAAGLKLNHHDQAGVGALELVDDGRLATWRYTLAHNLAALRVIAEFDLHRDSLVSGRPVASGRRRPRNARPLPPGEDECPICNRESTVARRPGPCSSLWRFARPYRWQLFLGFALTLATPPTLVPPHLTMPLMDNVLIPFQNGKPIDWPLVSMYLGGLLGAAVLAWVLGWIRTYILSLVSRTHRPRPAHANLRAPARPVAGIFRRQNAPAT